jgi:hypothetical protein
MYTDTPIPQEEPAGENPPDGAVINYYLKENVEKELTIEILDAKGNLVSKYSSFDKPYVKPADNVPDYWVRPQQLLSTSKGSRRFLWDMRYSALDLPATYPIGAVYKNTAPNPTAPFVMPGTYTVRLTVDGKSFTQPLKVKMDPRVKTSLKDLQVQHDLSKQIYVFRKALIAYAPATEETFKEKPRLLSQSGSLFDTLQETDMPPT